MADPKQTNQVTVIVEYVGKEPFIESVPPTADIQSVFVRALKKFGLDPGASSEYVLQHDGIDVPAHAKLEQFKADPVQLTLNRKSEPNKG